MKLFFAAVAVCLASAASATTITFDYGGPSSDTHIGGFTYQGTSQGFSFQYEAVYALGPYLNFHDDSGLLSSTIQAVNGSKFDVLSMDLRGISRVQKTGAGPKPVYGTPEHKQWLNSGVAPDPTLTFTGLVNGTAVASQTFGPTALSTVNFSSAFKAIDQLLIKLNIPTDIKFIEQAGSDTAWCPSWCANFIVDNVTVAPVPLPASGLLLFGALAGLMGYRRSTGSTAPA